MRKIRAETGQSFGAVKRVAEQLGYGVESVRSWVKQADIDDGTTAGVTTVDAERLKRSEQENRELRRANEILRRASAFFGFVMVRVPGGVRSFFRCARPSIGTVEDSYDNALAETVNGMFKTELIRRQAPWRTVDDVELATLGWVDWFNNRRLHSALGDVPPAEFEAAYYAQPVSIS